MATPADKARHKRHRALVREIKALRRQYEGTTDPREEEEIFQREKKLYRRYLSQRRGAGAAGRACLRRACQFCGFEDDLHAHHIDGNLWDNGLPNIATLCDDCHKWIHSLLRPRDEWSSEARRRAWRELLKDAKKGLVRAGYSPRLAMRRAGCRTEWRHRARWVEE